MEGKGEKALKRPLVYSASEIEDEVRNALKGLCEDLVDSASAAASGRKAQVKRKHPCEDLVENSSSASTSDASGQVKRKRLCVENPSSASTTNTGTKAEVRGGCRRPSAYPSEYAFIEYPDANAYGGDIPYETFLEGDRIVRKIASCCYMDRDPHAIITSERPIMKRGLQPPPDPNYSYKGDPFYEAAVASGAKVTANERIMMVKPNRYLW